MPAELELVAMLPGKVAGAVSPLLLDRTSNRLVALDWIPGAGFTHRGVDLLAELPREIHDASASRQRLVIYDSEERVFAADLHSGAVSQIWKVSGAVALAPDGRQLIAAADDGLLAAGFSSSLPGAPVDGTDLRRVLTKTLEPCNIAIAAGAEDDRFEIVVGCYGWIELVSVEMQSDESGSSVTVSTRSVSPGELLAYDPILVAVPRIVGPVQAGQWIYAIDEGRTGVVAVDLRSDAVVGYPRDAVRYGSIRRALPALDSSACLVRTAEGSWVRWSPEEGTAPVRPPRGEILLWQRENALLFERDQGVVREVRLAT